MAPVPPQAAQHSAASTHGIISDNGNLMKLLLLALLSGLLFALSLPPFNWEWLGWGAFVPLLLAASGRRPLEAVGLGMLAGAACGVASAGRSHDTSWLFWACILFL